MSGLRISEVLDLKVQDILYQNHMILVRNGKGGKQRNVVCLWILRLAYRYGLLFRVGI